MAESMASTAPRRAGALKTWAGRLAGIAFGVLLAWLLVEVLIRLLFFSLPPRLQLVLEHVRKTPFSDARLLPDPIWQPDTDYLMIARPVQNYEQFGSAEVRFTVSTETLWGSRVAFRTRQEWVDRHVDAVAVGDSFTFCFTDEQDCWVQQLGALTGLPVQAVGEAYEDFGPAPAVYVVPEGEKGWRPGVAGQPDPRALPPDWMETARWLYLAPDRLLFDRAHAIPLIHIRRVVVTERGIKPAENPFDDNLLRVEYEEASGARCTAGFVVRNAGDWAGILETRAGVPVLLRGAPGDK